MAIIVNKPGSKYPKIGAITDVGQQMLNQMNSPQSPRESWANTAKASTYDVMKKMGRTDDEAAVNASRVSWDAWKRAPQQAAKIVAVKNKKAAPKSKALTVKQAKQKLKKAKVNKTV